MKKILLAISIFINLTVFNLAYADETIPPAVIAPTLDITADVDVPLNCTSIDTDGVTHNYPTDSTTVAYLGICALEKAVQDGSITSIGLSNEFPSIGLFVTKINDIAADPSNEYWALYQNGSFAEFGITSLPVTTGDKIVLERQDFSGKNLGDKLTINIRSLISPTPTSDSGGNETSSKNSGGSRREVETSGEVLGVSTDGTFNQKKALEFLLSRQEKDGSFGQELYTDWVAIALASTSEQNQDIKPIIKLVKYLSENRPKGKLLTDFERRAMALMALGLNPYNTNGENYIEKIVSSFDGTQFGDLNEDNDDIFALIVLRNAGFEPKEKMIKDATNFILQRQKENGSWDESVDMTGAGIVALHTLGESEKTNIALQKAKNFLVKTQNQNGGWKNSVSSTAWAMGGILGLKEKPIDWKEREKKLSPLDYFVSSQGEDGGMKNLSFKDNDQNIENQIWETAYALTAYSGKTWDQIMQQFEKGNLEKKIETETSEEELKAKEGVSIVVQPPKKMVQKVANTEILVKNTQKEKTETQIVENQANILNTLPETNTIKEENWFKKMLNAIFNF